MFSRAEELEQVYIEMPKVKDTSEKLSLVIKANPQSIQETHRTFYLVSTSQTVTDEILLPDDFLGDF